MFFAAGTGVLPFVDLIAKFAQNRIYRILTSEDVSIELHATFRRFEDAAGIELCELLNEYERKQPHPRFRLFVRYSDFEQAKWNR